MAAYVIFIREKVRDRAGLAKYSELASKAPLDKLEVLASSKTSKFQVLEGPPAEAVVILRFPSMSDALEWYNSDAYQKALPHRLAVGDFRGFLLDGMS
jgi:uncharacterized protein (DUF1330 family)